MSKKKMLRIRRKTYEKLNEIAEDEELTISELADRVLSDYIENYSDDQDDTDEDDSDEDDLDDELDDLEEEEDDDFD